MYLEIGGKREDFLVFVYATAACKAAGENNIFFEIHLFLSLFLHRMSSRCTSYVHMNVHVNSTRTHFLSMQGVGHGMFK